MKRVVYLRNQAHRRSTWSRVPWGEPLSPCGEPCHMGGWMGGCMCVRMCISGTSGVSLCK